MSETKKLHDSILEVMEKVKYLNKNEAVQSFKSVNIEKVLTALRSAIVAAKITIIQSNVEFTQAADIWEETDQNGKIKRKTQFVFHALVTYKITHAQTGETEEMQSVGTGIDSLDKAPGKALTYAIKSALLN